MHNLEKLLIQRLAVSLKRKAISNCSDWAEQYRIMGEPFPGHYNFKHHPWCREIHDCNDQVIVNQKSAQMGLTETALNRVFFTIDILGRSVLYILPTGNPDCTDFSSSRFDPALELSPHLGNLFTEVKNVGHKRAGSASLFVRGSRSRSQLKSLPVGLIIFDEVDEMNQDNIILAAERTSGQREWQHFYLSTPTIDDYGINLYYKDSTQDHFFFKCPSCSQYIELLFPDNLVITSDDPNSQEIKASHLKCNRCDAVLPHQDKTNFLAKGIYRPTFSDKDYRGFYINQLYSCTVPPYIIARNFLKAQLNPQDEQEFYNSKLGLTHVVEGAQVTDQDIQNCTGGHQKQQQRHHDNVFVTMGVDVGSDLHCEIVSWKRTNDDLDPNLAHEGKLIYEGKIKDFERLDEFMRQFNVAHCVVDAQPERRKALEFAQRFSGHVNICYYPEGMKNREISFHSSETYGISVDRTSWLDVSLGRVRKNAIRFPINLSLEYREHIKALTRIYERDKNDNPIGRYVKGNRADHFAHARNYCEIALYIAAGAPACFDMDEKVF